MLRQLRRHNLPSTRSVWRGKEQTPKSRKSIRAKHLLDGLTRVLQSHRELCVGKQPEDHLFVNAAGQFNWSIFWSVFAAVFAALFIVAIFIVWLMAGQLNVVNRNLIDIESKLDNLRKGVLRTVLARLSIVAPLMRFPRKRS